MTSKERVVDARYRVYAMIGDPVEQTKSPYFFNQHCHLNDIEAVMVPVRIPADKALESFVTTLRDTRMFEGVVSTIPHKSSLAKLMDELGPAATSLGVVNAVKFTEDGELYGDMFDGSGFTNALAKNSFDPNNIDILIIGGGAAGTAIALALHDQGACRIDIVEPDPTRRAAINEVFSCFTGIEIHETTPALISAHLIVNASPLGMNRHDPKPVDPELIAGTAFVADAITSPPITTFLQVAKEKGCSIQTGAEMAAGHLAELLEFFNLTAQN